MDMLAGSDLGARARLVIGTRGSPLALAQAHMTQAGLAAVFGLAVEALPLDVIKTSGDRILDRALEEAGGKGLFTKEIDEAQLAGRVDIAVHSAKDLPTTLPEGLVVAAYLPREDVRDAFISPHFPSLAALPTGGRIGSASLRRRAMARRLRPDIETDLLRGNVQTRLAKLAAGEFHATFLALAGLKRLGLADRATKIMETDEFLPAVGQGAIALVTRQDDEEGAEAARRIGCVDTFVALRAERALLGVLDGSCRTPIGGHARLVDGRLHLAGLVLKPDGSAWAEGERVGAPEDAEAMGLDLGAELRLNAPPGALG